MEPQSPHETNTIQSKKNNAGMFYFPDFKTYYRSLVRKTIWHWHQNIHREQIQDRPKHECTTLQTFHILLGHQKYKMEKRHHVQQSVLEKLGVYIKNEIRPISFTLQKK